MPYSVPKTQDKKELEKTISQLANILHQHIEADIKNHKRQFFIDALLALAIILYGIGAIL